MGLTALVAEDSETQRRRIGAELRAQGIAVVLCADGREALETARAQRPDVILSDVLMPEMDGFRLCREIKLDPELVSIPVVLRTGAFISEEDQRFALSLGARAYIQKDTPASELGFLLRAIAREPQPATGHTSEDTVQDESFHGPYQERLLHRLVEEAAGLERANEKLHESQQRLQAILDNSPLFIYAKDLAGVYVLANRHFAREFELSPEDVVGRTDKELFGDINARQYTGNDAEVIERGREVHVEESMVRGDGPHTYLSTKFPLWDADGGIAGVGGLSLDITERQRLEERLRHAEKMEAVGRLASGVAHDFNNLLTVISNYVRFVYEDLEDATHREDLENVLDASERGSKLVRQLLTLSRRELGTVTAVELSGAIGGMEDILRTSLGARVSLELDLPEGLPPIEIDPAHVDQILLNLVVNARDAIAEQGSVSISARELTLTEPISTRQCEVMPGRYIVLSVSDDGMGMSRQTIDQAFEPFFTTKPEGSGTGLGLATLHGIVNGLGGYVTVDSELGKGTRFTIYLPVSTAGSGTEEPPAPSGAGTILIVDDEAPLRDLVRRMLTKHGHEVLVAMSGSEALEIFRRHKNSIDLVLTDIVMPGMTGIELEARLRELEPSLNLAYMSGSSSGVHDRPMLRKPFGESPLIEFVGEVIGTDRAETG